MLLLQAAKPGLQKSFSCNSAVTGLQQCRCNLFYSKKARFYRNLNCSKSLASNHMPRRKNILVLTNACPMQKHVSYSLLLNQIYTIFWIVCQSVFSILIILINNLNNSLNNRNRIKITVLAMISVRTYAYSGTPELTNPPRASIYGWRS